MGYQSRMLAVFDNDLARLRATALGKWLPVLPVLPAWVLITAMAALTACVGSTQSTPIVSKAGATNTFTNDVSSGDGTGGVSDASGSKDLPKISTAETVGDGGGGDALVACSCKGIECGSPPGCPEMKCDACPKGALCNKNTCESDPNCACGSQDCGILPGCGKDCGGCEAPMQCNVEKAACELDCSCATQECGQVVGCPTSCGKCEIGKVCGDFICKPDPKCVCKVGMCEVIPGCPANCGTCAVGEKCVANKCTAGGEQCLCTNITCGFAKPACVKSCGICQINQICSSNACKTVGSNIKKKFGEPCGPSEECPVPPAGSSQFAQKQFLECQHNQCENGLCIGGVCTKKCKMTLDQVNNVTGANEPDGIEDPGQPSECTGAANGPVGAAFKCVEQNSPGQVVAGFTDPACLPGSAFTPCATDKTCPAGEVCRVMPFMNGYQARCAPKVANPIGSPGVKPSQACNPNPTAGPVAMCETGWCKQSGCVGLCEVDADCTTAAGACKAGQCHANGALCNKDAECPTWTCKPAVQFVDTSLVKFSACQP